jgi:hypothetical protein
MRLKYSLMLGAAAVAPVAATVANAADLTVGVEVPQLNVAEYHRPYVSMWIERKDQSFVNNLAVWYQVKSRNQGEGEKWLKDMRGWWRKSGRELKFPIDGVTSATRPVGTHKVTFNEGTAPFAKLPAGDYRLIVEAARESGGREILSVPFQWPPKKAEQLKQQGKDELGLVTLELKP